MPNYTKAQIEQLWDRNGGNPALADVMSSIALAESGGSPTVVNNTPSTGDYSVGLWQINYFGDLYRPRSAAYGTPAQLAADPNAQAKAAISLAGNGSGLSNWTTYTSGAYKGTLAGAAASTANATLTASSSSTGGAGPSGCSGCAISMPSVGPIGGGCIISNCNLKALKGGLLVAAGGALLVVGGLVLVAYGFAHTGAGQTASKALKRSPAGRVTSRVSGGSQSRTAPEGDDPGDALFEVTRGSRAANRSYYRQQLRDTSDLRRRTA